MKNVVPEEVLKEIFQRKLKSRDLTGQVYNELRKMILSGKLSLHLPQPRLDTEKGFP
jgi:DNA-binding GntR family transcriptional regulator